MRFNVNIEDIASFNTFLGLVKSERIDVLLTESFCSFIFNTTDMFLVEQYSVLSSEGYTSPIYFRIEKDLVGIVVNKGILTFDIDGNILDLVMEESSSESDKNRTLKARTNMQACSLTDIDKYLRMIRELDNYEKIPFSSLSSVTRLASMSDRGVTVNNGWIRLDVLDSLVYRECESKNLRLTIGAQALSLLNRVYRDNESAEIFDVKNYLVERTNNKYLFAMKNKYKEEMEIDYVLKKGSSHIIECDFKAVVNTLKKLRAQEIKNYKFKFVFNEHKCVLHHKYYDLDIPMKILNVKSTKRNEDSPLDLLNMNFGSPVSLNLNEDREIAKHNIPDVTINLENLIKLLRVISGGDYNLKLKIKKKFIQIEYKKFIIVIARVANG